MTTPCLKQTTSLHDSTNLRLNSWVFSHLDASIWSVSTASANNMGGMTDLGIAAFMRYCSIVLTFSSKWMMELKKETGVIWNPTYFNVIYWWITGGWTRSIWLQKFFQFVFDDFCSSFNDALSFITSILSFVVISLIAYYPIGHVPKAYNVRSSRHFSKEYIFFVLLPQLFFYSLNAVYFIIGRFFRFSREILKSEEINFILHQITCKIINS